ncbi:MAG: RNA-guided pseudouridylation complex pseudouridine synthase subunit Cbf5 [Nitrososphaerales archaeon]
MYDSETFDMIDLPQFKQLMKLDEDTTDDRYGHYPDRRPIQELLDYGLIPIDKPAGPTSHEVVAWVKRILQIEKAGHSGTLDPPATGLLPIGLGEGTKALSALLFGPKEYYALARLHATVSSERLRSVAKEFVGEIYQRPPQRSSVKREVRIRNVYELDVMEESGRLILLHVLCQAGTYIRKIIYDIGEVLGCGATMVELRRTRVSNLDESTGLVRLHDLADAYNIWKETGKEDKLRDLVQPIEISLGIVKAVIIRDSAVDALCHGAQLAMPGLLKIPRDLKKNDFVGVYTLKGEIVGLAEAAMSAQEIVEADKGIAFNIKRIIMKPDTYPKSWRTRAIGATQ